MKENAKLQFTGCQPAEEKTQCNSFHEVVAPGAVGGSCEIAAKIMFGVDTATTAPLTYILGHSR